MQKLTSRLLPLALALATLLPASCLLAQSSVGNGALTPASSLSKSKTPGDAYWATAGTGHPGGAVVGPEGVLSAAVVNSKTPGKDIQPARASAIQEAAATYGTQAGLAWRVQEITRQLDSHAASYDRVFNFGAVMLEPGFLPPVISQGQDLYNQTDGSTVRAAERLYKIEFPARLVNTPPRWQDYLALGVSAPQTPDQTVLPKTADERALWDAWAQQGWAQGVEQGNQMFEANLGRLKRDFEGMVRFKTLYQQGMVTKPVLARTNLGVTGGGDEMAVGDRIIRITLKAGLQPSDKRWASSAPSPVLPEDQHAATDDGQ
jgi:defect-in-organelle-trafficking protein DotC